MSPNPSTKTIIKHCTFCGGQTHLRSSSQQMVDWMTGTHAQNAWPEKSAGWRETMISGTHGFCFDEAFAEPEDDDHIGTVDSQTLGYKDDRGEDPPGVGVPVTNEDMSGTEYEAREKVYDEFALGPCGCTDYHMADCPLLTDR